MTDGAPSARRAERAALRGLGVPLEIAALRRDGPGAPILFLHGFGSTKEDYADIALHPAFDAHPVLAYDAPGCGRSVCAELDRLGMPLLVETAVALLDAFGVERAHVVGHSMGGLTGLLLADRHSERVLSFSSIEGNVAPEDCFLSRQILSHADPDPERFLEAFALRASQAPAFASALFSASLPHKVRAGAVGPIFTSMVEASDRPGLLDRFLGLPMPRMFMHGAQNAGLSYLPRLRAEGVRVEEISDCGHFPMYSNPVAMWRALHAFIRETAETGG